MSVRDSVLGAPFARAKHPPRSWARRAIVTLSVIAVAALVLGSLAVTYVAQTQTGRAWLAHRIGEAVSAAIPGSLLIGRIDAVGALPLSLAVHDLKLLDAQGMTVLHARDAKLAVAVLALIGGRLHVTDAEVEGGQLVIAIQRSGKSSLETALSAAPVDGAREDDAGMALHFDAISVRQYVVELKMSPDDVIRIRVQSARVTIDNPPAVVGMHEIRARVQTPQIAGANVRILHADGWVHADGPQILDLTLQTAIGDGKLDAQLAYFSRDKTPVVVRINPHDGLQAEIAGILLEAKTWGTDTVEVTFDERVTAQARRAR